MKVQGLENRRLHHAVEQTLAGLRSYGLTIRPAVGSAVKAYMEAVNHPGSLIRVTTTAVDEMVLFDCFVGMDKNGRDAINWNKTLVSTDERPELELLLEFKNGSGIELVRAT